MIRTCHVIYWFLVLLLAGFAPARAGAHSEARLVSEAAAFKPGKPFRLALVIRPEEGWHVYWKNPGDSGLAPTLTWALPEGAVASAPAFPAPDRIPVGPLVNYGYGKETAYIVTVTPPDNDARPMSLRLKAEWLVCELECVPESGSFDLRLPSGRAALDARTASLFRKFDAAMPRTLPWTASALRDDKRFRIEIAMPEAERALVRGGDFIPETGDLIVYTDPIAVGRTATGLIVEGKSPAALPPSRARGVLQLTSGAGVENFAIDLPVVNGAVTGRFEPVGRLSWSGFAGILALAFLGGLILNAMPCVFPVLSLKILHLLKSAGETDRLSPRREGRAYTFGVLASFLGLAALFILLRQAGVAIGWGFQLQSPPFVAALAAVMTGIVLNLAGVFEISGRAFGFGGGLAGRGGALGSFFTGALAVLVATPCTAPFMAAALGSALLLPPVQALLVFAVMGLGLAMPFLLFSHFPAAARWMPRPGPWMQTLRKSLSVPMILTALWLLSILWKQIPPILFVIVLGGLALLVLGLVLFGRGLKWGLSAGTLGLLVMLASYAVWPASSVPAGEAEAPGRWSEARVKALQAEGRPVFVNFTADWCITCKVNERVALADPGVSAVIEQKGIAVLIADWTRRDGAIAKTLAARGRAGVPLYLYYPPGRGKEPVELPQILTPDLLLAVFSGEKD